MSTAKISCARGTVPVRYDVGDPHQDQSSGRCARGRQNMVDALLRINPRMAKLKADDLIDSSFIDW